MLKTPLQSSTEWGGATCCKPDRVSLASRSGHQSFSNSRKVNDLVGNIVHSSILVPYHGWRISHRTHHSNHGHVENDESWHPVTKSIYEKMVRSTALLKTQIPCLRLFPAARIILLNTYLISAVQSSTEESTNCLGRCQR